MPGLIERYGTVVAGLVMIAVFVVFAPNFATAPNLINVLKDTSFLAILALGFALALIVAELDLSVADIASLGAVMVGWLVQMKLDPGLAALAAATPALAANNPLQVGIIGFQFSAETHARVANAAAAAAAAAAKARGWNVTLLNSEGSLPKHAEQFDALIAKKVDAIILAMGKPVEADAQFKAAKDAGIAVITVQSGTSPHALFDIQANEYKIGAEAALFLLGAMNYQGNLLSIRFDANAASRIRGRVLDVVMAENQGIKEIGKFTMARTQSWRDDVRSGAQALLLQNQGKINGIWVSFDGQAYIVDDLLQAAGVKRGQIPMVSIDGGPESYRRIADPSSLLLATVAVPFESMGTQAIEAIEAIVVKKQPKTSFTTGPYLFVDAVLVDASNVKQFLK